MALGESLGAIRGSLRALGESLGTLGGSLGILGGSLGTGIPRGVKGGAGDLRGVQKIVTRSVFELQKRLSTQNASSRNFLNILVNKFFHTRPLTSIFGDHDVNNRCLQLITAVNS